MSADTVRLSRPQAERSGTASRSSVETRVGILPIFYGRSVRGALDRLVGGIGLRRGRRDPYDIMIGDALDFWRVLDMNPPFDLTLVAEMKLPGEAVMAFSVHSLTSDRTELQLLSRFLPRGLWGMIYWYGLYPFHQWIYAGMLKKLALSVGKPVLEEPERFAPRRQHVCHIRTKRS